MNCGRFQLPTLMKQCCQWALSQTRRASPDLMALSLWWRTQAKNLKNVAKKGSVNGAVISTSRRSSGAL